MSLGLIYSYGFLFDDGYVLLIPCLDVVLCTLGTGYCIVVYKVSPMGLLNFINFNLYCLFLLTCIIKYSNVLSCFVGLNTLDLATD